MSLDKEQLKSAALDLLNTKIAVLTAELKEINEALTDNTKSTAGDKHETSRAHAQIEQERIGNQLGQLNKMRDILTSITTNSSEKATAGSIVSLSNGYFYISVPLGELKLNNQKVFCLSPTSPLAQQLLGKTAGDKIELNGKTLMIEGVN